MYAISAIENHEPLGDLLVLSHTSVPDKILVEFLKTGAPPNDYVFVSFIEPSHGCSLIREDDLELVDRVLEMGQAVKRHLDSTVSGTVISSSAKCSLEPIAYRVLDPRTGEYGPVKFAEKAKGRHASTPPVHAEDADPPSLHDVPMSELKNYEQFSEGDYIIYRQKVGVINQIDRDAILLLPNKKTVSPIDPYGMELPLLSDTKNVVAMPNHPDTIHSYPLDSGGFLWTSESESLFPGQFAITAMCNLTRGDLISDAGSQVDPEGYILDTPATDYHIDWVCPNVFAVGLPYSSANSEMLRASVLNDNAVKCDFGQLPKEALNKKGVNSDVWLKIGDRVRFRDPKDADTKYPPFKCIPVDESFGYDINVLRITATKTEVTVQWQDGSITTEEATALHKFSSADDEVWPGNLVVLKDGVETIHEPLPANVGPMPAGLAESMMESLRLKKIGVVQTVDGRERIASVRWYENPDVVLMHQGNMLKPGSSLGKLGTTVTDVSIYELKSYSCLAKSLADLVLLVPKTVHQSAMPTTNSNSTFKAAGPCQLSFLFPITFFETFLYLEAMKLKIVGSEWFKKTTSIDTSPAPSRFSVHHDEFSVKSPANFIGKVVSMDTDGVITVRLAGADNCHDIRVPLERMMLVLNEGNSMPLLPFPPLDLLGHGQHSLFGPLNDALSNPQFGAFDDDPSDLYEAMFDSMYDRPTYGSPFSGDDHPLFGRFDEYGPSVSRTFEYEGGQRLDDDGREDDWLTEDEDLDGTDGSHVDSIGNNEDNIEVPDVADINPPEKSGTSGETKDPKDRASASQVTEKPSALSSSLPSECPPAFSLLEGSPPSDHHFLCQSPTGASGISIKRIRKEFEILRSSLPPGIFVRAWESRMDLLRVLIVGPQGTPYEHAPFVIDFHLSNHFPNRPPSTFFHSWTNMNGRINPNLYEDGKICLSILGTWPTQNPDESWSPVKSTLLQVLVSIMGLVLVKAPFYNEAGYEAFAAEGNKQVESIQYSEKAFLITRKFIQHALEHPVAGMEDVLTWHYFPNLKQQEESCVRPQLLRRAIEGALSMIEHHNRTSTVESIGEDDVASAFVPRLSLGAVVLLRKHIHALEQIESTMSA
ncbi:hypothetical protein EYZ11_011143 [Aspergillus tanneri]|uniref:UBC core domain-containing protein n=1 Tax=Aspergillus tanneri TaxID=1220188 RepID=A0A4S3J3J4_9EURO|nr:hypothetical protein EYZ11_011143 [Aspergillus tanneri]